MESNFARNIYFKCYYWRPAVTKKYYKQIAAIMLLFGCLFASLVSYAEERKEEWKDPNYNVSQINRILVKLNTDIALSQIDRFKLNSLLAGYWNGKQKASEAQLKNMIFQSVGEDLGVLRLIDAEKYGQLIKDYLPIFAKGDLNINVRKPALFSDLCAGVY